MQKNSKTTFKEIISLSGPLTAVLLVVALIPLVVVVQQVSVPESIAMYWKSYPYHLDFFSFCKAVLLISLCVINILVVISVAFSRIAERNPRFHKPLGRLLTVKNENGIHFVHVAILSLSVYSLFTILSSLFSEYPEVAYMGFPDRYEGMWVLLGYVFLLGTVYSLVEEERQLTIICAGIAVSGVVMCVIGIGQFFGYDFFRTDLGKALLVPEMYAEIRESLNFNFGEGTIYSTLFNTNNVGSMMSMLTVASLALVITVKHKTYRILLLIFTALVAFNLLGSNSRGGYVGAVIGIAALFVVLAVVFGFKKSYLIATGGVAVVGVVAVVIGMSVFPNLSNMGITALLGPEALPYEKNAPSATVVYDFTTGTNSATVETDAGDITITYGTPLTFTDSDGTVLTATQSGVEYLIEDERFSSMRVFLPTDMENTFVVELGYQLPFTFSEGEIWFANANDNLVKTEDPKTVPLLERYGHMGSARGAIWSRSIPLITDNLIIGKGPDTYAMYYPQFDFGAKIRFHGTPYIIVDKPHSQYLQILLNQGMIAFLAFMTAIIVTGLAVLKAIIKFKKEDSSADLPMTLCYSSAFLCGMAAYMGAALFNDSIVSVAPIFWVMWGMCLAGLRLESAKAEMPVVTKPSRGRKA